MPHDVRRHFQLALYYRIARNQRESTQALFAAEGGVRIVKKWFDTPSGSAAYLVPTTSQMDRNHRFVDDDYDGTYGPYVSAIPPFNVIYRQGTNDPFERPYRGTPARANSSPHSSGRCSAGRETSIC